MDRGLVAAIDAVKLRAVQISNDGWHRHNPGRLRELLCCLNVKVDKSDIAVLLLELLELGLEQLAGIAPRGTELDDDPWCAVDELLNVIVVSNDQLISSLRVAS